MIELIISPKSLQALLHPKVAQPLTQHYTETLRIDLLKEAPIMIQEAIESGMTQITIRRIGPNVGKYLSPGDLALLEHLPSRPALYTVRLHHKNDTLGLRLNGFFYDHEHKQWKSFFKLGEILEPWNRDQLKRLQAQIRSLQTQ